MQTYNNYMYDDLFKQLAYISRLIKCVVFHWFVKIRMRHYVEILCHFNICFETYLKAILVVSYKTIFMWMIPHVRYSILLAVVAIKQCSLQNIFCQNFISASSSKSSLPRSMFLLSKINFSRLLFKLLFWALFNC